MIIVATLAAIAEELASRRRTRRIASSGCTGWGWRRAFPAASKQDIREFYQVLLVAFGLGEVFHLRFGPDLPVMDLYHAVVPGWFGVDDLELETFSLLIEERFGIDISERLGERSTLGDVFAMVQANHQ